MQDLLRGEDRRSRARFRLNMPLVVLLAGLEVFGYTRDVSNEGVYFFVDPADEGQIQGEIQFVIDLPPEVTLSRNCNVRCSGIVVRKEIARNHPAGIGAAILHYSLPKEGCS